MDKIIKRLTSYFKKNWDIDDYPVELYRNENASEDNVKFGALITDWSGMVGHGETKEKAFESLKDHFKIFKDNNELPRPGTKVPLMFAPTVNINKFEDIGIDFFKKILNQNYLETFQTDGSYIELMFIERSDRELVKIKDDIIIKTKNEYGVDISDVYDQELWKIFEKIKNGS